VLPWDVQPSADLTVFIITDSGEDLNELLVANALARIDGTRTVLFDQRDSKPYIARLKELEAQGTVAKTSISLPPPLWVEAAVSRR
jgi:hypothetical protein